jgi:hypothetical protein
MTKKFNSHGLSNISSENFNIAETLSLSSSTYYFEPPPAGENDIK